MLCVLKFSLQVVSFHDLPSLDFTVHGSYLNQGLDLGALDICLRAPP